MKEWGTRWCLTCCTLHEQTDSCPGELLATGAERHGWRALAETPRGLETYGTLIAPAGERWRARILTYPNVLWVIRRGLTMKFVGSTAGEAEQAAIEFIKDHCARRRIKIQKEGPVVEADEIDLELDETALQAKAVEASRRKIRSVQVRYGVTRCDTSAETEDLSEGGLFIRTPRPLPVGTELQLYVQTKTFGIPLRGAVRWTRARVEQGRPVGMGIQLIQPHRRYIQFVREQES